MTPHKSIAMRAPLVVAAFGVVATSCPRSAPRGGTTQLICEYGAGEFGSPIGHREEYSSEDVESIGRAVSTTVGLYPKFIMREGDTALASALIEGSQRVIEYRKGFYASVVDAAGTRWAAYGVLAHEMGHHFLFHTERSTRSHFDMELEADEWSGFVLGKLGASQEETLMAVRHLARELGDLTHPPRADRIKAVEKGWLEGRPVRRWEVSSPQIFGPGTPPMEYDVVVVRPGASIRVLGGARFELTSKEIVLEVPELVVDGRGANASPAPRGEPCPNCCNGRCPDWDAESDKAYDDANGACSGNLSHHDNGLLRAGDSGGPGATIQIHATVRGNGKLICLCNGGAGGTGGKRGSGKVHFKPGHRDPWECPGDPHRNDTGPQGANGPDGACACP